MPSLLELSRLSGRKEGTEGKRKGGKTTGWMGEGENRMTIIRERDWLEGERLDGHRASPFDEKL